MRGWIILVAGMLSQFLSAAAYGAPEARLEAERVTLASRILGESREALVGLPKSYATSGVEYPVVLVLDGEWQFDRVTPIVRFLADAGAMPECIVVGLTNTDRERDMTPTGMRIAGVPAAGGDAFLEFLDEEFFPALRDRYRTGDLRVLVGHSHGGIIGVYALARRPALFSGVVALDAPPHLDGFWLIDQLRARLADADAGPVRLALGQARFRWDDDQWNEISDEAPEGSILERFTTEGETHESMVFLGAYLGLRAIFAPYADASPEWETLGAIEAAYDDAAAALGGPLPTPAVALRSALDGALMEGRGADAEALLNRLEALYGETDTTRALRTRVHEALALGPLEETVQDLVTGPRASRKEMEPFLGVWEGVVQSGGGSESRIRFTFEWTDSGVVGAATQWMPNGEARTQELVVIRLRDGALQFGYMNGMRPRGVLLYSCAPEGKGDEMTLSGGMTMAGVRFIPPGGRKAPNMETLVRLSRSSAG